MPTIKLTLFERASLINQFLILKGQGGADEDYDKRIEILQAGYEDLYGDALGGLFEHVPESVTMLVRDVLSMFRAIDDFKRGHPNESIAGSHTSFHGFRREQREQPRSVCSISHREE